MLPCRSIGQNTGFVIENLTAFRSRSRYSEWTRYIYASNHGRLSVLIAVSFDIVSLSFSLNS